MYQRKIRLAVCTESRCPRKRREEPIVKVHLQDYFRAFLLRSPFYTSTFLTTQECKAPMIVMRVEDLYLFEQKGYRARVGFRTWRNEQQTWVVAVPFCLELSPRLKAEGLLFLNPRRAV